MQGTKGRFFQYITGLLIKTFGLALVIQSHLGTGAWEALYVGLSEQTGYSIGWWIFIVGFCLILFNSFLWGKKPTYASFFTVTIVALFIDWWLAILSLNPSEIIFQMLVFWTGLLVASFGASIYLISSFTPTPVDQLMFALSYRFRISIMFTKTIGEVFALLLAVRMHGEIGVGTIIFTLLFGPLIHCFISIWNGKRSKVIA